MTWRELRSLALGGSDVRLLGAIEPEGTRLRKARVPSLLVEIHHALEGEEEARWAEGGTTDAFATVVAAALVDALRPATDRARRRHRRALSRLPVVSSAS